MPAVGMGEEGDEFFVGGGGKFREFWLGEVGRDDAINPAAIVA